jgi:hypothetical protein
MRPESIANEDQISRDQSVESEAFISAVRQLTLAVNQQVDNQRSWKLIFRNGVVAGLGGVLGATVVLSLLLYILQPLKRIEALNPTMERLDNTLKRAGK